MDNVLDRALGIKATHVQKWADHIECTFDHSRLTNVFGKIAFVKIDNYV